VAGIAESELGIKVTGKGRVALPKAAREAAEMGFRARTEGGLIIEAETSAEAYLVRLEDMSRKQPIRGFSTEQIMRMSRGED
jgi:bifunctional DNA-binding transcriptional regulator/antitoxin component of YhaV-PrlF toxin-antitoxin module